MQKPLTRPVARLILVGAVWALCADTLWAAPMYNIADLGTLPGQAESIATGINDQGQVVGVSGNSINLGGEAWPSLNVANNPGVSSFLYSGGQMTQINPIGGPAQAINNAGQVVGGWNRSINNSGQYVDGNSLVTGGTTTTFGNFHPAAINDSGEMAGSLGAGSHVAIYQGGQVTDLTRTLGLNSDSGQAYAINNAGDVLFYYLDKTSNDIPRYALYHANGQMVSLPGVPPSPNGPNGLPAALNNVGQVVGSDFLYTGGQLYLLKDLLPTTNKWTGITPMAINDAGQIAGAGFIDGKIHAFLMTPAATQSVPEPPTLALFVIAASYPYLKTRARRKSAG